MVTLYLLLRKNVVANVYPAMSNFNSLVIELPITFPFFNLTPEKLQVLEVTFLSATSSSIFPDMGFWCFISVKSLLGVRTGTSGLKKDPLMTISDLCPLCNYWVNCFGSYKINQWSDSSLVILSYPVIVAKTYSQQFLEWTANSGKQVYIRW